MSAWEQAVACSSVDNWVEHRWQDQTPEDPRLASCGAVPAGSCSDDKSFPGTPGAFVSFQLQTGPRLSVREPRQFGMLVRSHGFFSPAQHEAGTGGGPKRLVTGLLVFPKWLS